MQFHFIDIGLLEVPCAISNGNTCCWAVISAITCETFHEVVCFCLKKHWMKHVDFLSGWSKQLSPLAIAPCGWIVPVECLCLRDFLFAFCLTRTSQIFALNVSEVCIVLLTAENFAILLMWPSISFYCELNISAKMSFRLIS